MALRTILDRFEKAVRETADTVTSYRGRIATGDTFVAGFLYGKTRGWDIRRCARFANAAGSIAVEHTGANGGDYNRAVCVDKMTFNADGTINPVPFSKEGIFGTAEQPKK